MRHLVAALLLFTSLAVVSGLGGPRVSSAQTPATGTFASTPKYSANGDATVVFLGGTVAQLETAARNARAGGVWVQDAGGDFNLLVVGGPSFITNAFAAKFPTGIPVGAVTLRRATTIDALYPPAVGHTAPDVLFVMRTSLSVFSANESLQVVSLTNPALDHVVARGENVTYIGSSGSRLYYAELPIGLGTPIYREDGARAGSVLVGVVPAQRLTGPRISPDGNFVGYSGGGNRLSPTGEVLGSLENGVHIYDLNGREDRLVVATDNSGCSGSASIPGRCQVQLFEAWSVDGRFVVGTEVRQPGGTLSSWRAGPLPGLTRESLPARVTRPVLPSRVACVPVGTSSAPQLTTFDLSTGEQRSVPQAPSSTFYDATNFGSCLPSREGALAIVLGAHALGGRAIWMVDESGVPLFAPKVVELQPERWLPDGSGVVASFFWYSGDRNLTSHRDYFVIRRDGSIQKLNLPDAELVDILLAS